MNLKCLKREKLPRFLSVRVHWVITTWRSTKTKPHGITKRQILFCTSHVQPAAFVRASTHPKLQTPIALKQALFLLLVSAPGYGSSHSPQVPAHTALALQPKQQWGGSPISCWLHAGSSNREEEGREVCTGMTFPTLGAR